MCIFAVDIWKDYELFSRVPFSENIYNLIRSIIVRTFFSKIIMCVNPCGDSI